MKAEAILYTSEGVGIDIIAKMVERAERTVQEWRGTRMCSVLTGHAGNQNAAKPTRAQEQELKTILTQPLSRSGVHAEFWDVSAIREVVKILVRRRTPDGLLLPDAPAPVRAEPRTAENQFDKRCDKPAITRRMTEVKTQVEALLDQGWEVHTTDEEYLEHEAENRSMQLPEGVANRTSRGPAEDVPVLLRRPLPDQQEGHAVPDRGEPEHLADDPRAGPAPTRNRGRRDRGRSGQRPLPPCESVDRPPRAGPAVGAHHTGLSAAVRARPQPGRARPEHRQEQHHHPARDPRRNHHRIRPTRHRPHRRPQLRTPPTPRNQKRFCFMTAIVRAGFVKSLE